MVYRFLPVFFLCASLIAHAIDTTNTQYTIKVITGEEFHRLLPFIAEQRIEAYRPYPYLYEGSMEDEQRSLILLAQSAHAAVAVAYFNNTIVGLVPRIPLVDYAEEFIGSIEAFEKDGKNPNDYYYITDVIVQEAHQGKKLATHLIEQIEHYCSSLGYPYACFVCESYESHPLKPQNYRELDSLWERLGYRKSAICITFLDWNTLQPDGSTKYSPHVLPYWIKQLQPESSAK